jgi:transaldolase
MKIFFDTADIDQIISAHSTGLVDGITTNPTIIKKSGKDPVEVIKEFSTKFPSLESISAEVVADTCEEMLEQAKEFSSYANVTIKVPCTVEGLKACRKLSFEQNIDVNVTLIFTVSQAILAAKAGAKYVSPFVGRWFDQSIDGIGLISNIRKVYDNSSLGFTTRILSASIRDVSQVEKCAIAGTDVVTIPPIVFWSMYKNVLTDKGLEQFQKDWDSVVNK